MQIVTASSQQQPHVLIRALSQKDVRVGDSGILKISGMRFNEDEPRFCFIDQIKAEITRKGKNRRMILSGRLRYRGLQDYSELGNTRYLAEGVKFIIRRDYVLLDFSKARLVAMRDR